MEYLDDGIVAVFALIALAGAFFLAGELLHMMRALRLAPGAHRWTPGSAAAEAQRLATGACLALGLFAALYVVAHLAIALLGAWLADIGSAAVYLSALPLWPSLDDVRLSGCPDEYGRHPLPRWAWPGGYPLVYVDADGACLCPSCANEEDEERHLSPDDDGCLQSPVVSYFVNYEEEIYCDGCGSPQLGAYIEETEAGR